MTPAAPTYTDRGWRPSTGRPCPLTLAGRRCRWAGGVPCLCNRWLLDHPKRWLDRDGRPVLTAEPYSACGDDLAGFIAELDALGLTLHLSGRSPHAPGDTLLMVIERAADRPPAAAGTTP